MNVILNFGLIILIGIVAAKLLAMLKIPRVLAYVLVGTLLGGSVSGFIHPGLKNIESYITIISLSFIAFLIGDMFKWTTIKKIGTKAIWIAIIQSLITTIIVAAGIICLSKTHLINIQHLIPTALLLGACAAATAPAATFMIIREYKAKGILTNYILMAVSFDDAIGILLFDIAIVIAGVLLRNEQLNPILAIFIPTKAIFLSMLIGFLMGIVMSKIEKFFKGKEQKMILAFSFIFITTGLSQQFNISPLLSSMMLGATFVNFGGNIEKTFSSIEAWSAPLLVIFFILSGSNLDITLLPKVGVIGALYVILRTTGKIFGGTFGAFVTKAPKQVQKYLGVAMLPQAGVAIGFAIFISNLFPELSSIPTIVLAAVIIFEIIGPLATKFAVFRAGEVPIKEERL
ncbi:MAG: cation:proton antiporter [Caldisericota bacterium]|nr:cation:proton antiporter [Caldisericota bacterium]